MRAGSDRRFINSSAEDGARLACVLAADFGVRNGDVDGAVRVTVAEVAARLRLARDRRNRSEGSGAGECSLVYPAWRLRVEVRLRAVFLADALLPGHVRVVVHQRVHL